MLMLKSIFRKAFLVIVNPEAALTHIKNEKRSWLGWVLFLVVFSLFSTPFVTLKSAYGFGNSDWHFSGSAYADAVKNDYPHLAARFGPLTAKIMLIPIIWFNMILLVLIFSFLIWLIAKYVLKGSGTYYATCAGLAYTFLPSLLFGALPYSGILSATWTTVLQLILMPMVIHGLPFRKAMWLYIVFLAYLIYSIDFIGKVV